jgi:hypothetical protein
MKRLETRVKELELENNELNTRLAVVNKENNRRGDDLVVSHFNSNSQPICLHPWH